jgi:hypothetical protein
MNDFEVAKLERDKRLRRKILWTLRIVMGVNGSMEAGGRFILDQVNGIMPPGQQIEDDEHAVRLLRELKQYGLVEERDARKRKEQRFGLDWLQYKISGEGLALLNESRAPHPEVWDERMTPEE